MIKIKFYSLFIFALLTFSLALLNSCQKDFDFTTDPNAKLAFTADTLRFDTVFTSVGSATRFFKILNNNDKPIKISRIWLENPTPSVTGATFNMNVDGISGREFRDVEINANDSIYVFVETTINPNAINNPFIINHLINFETNGNQQKVVIEAWGQNANYIPNRWAQGKITEYDLNGGTWTWNDPKPYVIYGIVVVRNGTLELPAGCRVYVHGGLARDASTRDIYNDGLLVISSNASLISRGTKEKPVVLQGDRLEEEFKDEVGQWVGVLIAPTSSGNEATFTTVKNSRIGFYVDSNADLSLKNCRIFNTAASGLLAIHSTVRAENCLFHDNGGGAAQLEFGGDYLFQYCTMASFGTRQPALSMNNVRCYERQGIACTLAKSYPLKTRFRNCIVYGSKEDEIAIFDATDNTPQDCDFLFTNSIVRVKDLLKPAVFPNFLTQNCINCINAPSNAKLFKKTAEKNFQLDTLSIAEGRAVPIPTILQDLNLKLRDIQTPDIGCFEY